MQKSSIFCENVEEEWGRSGGGVGAATNDGAGGTSFFLFVVKRLENNSLFCEYKEVVIIFALSN
jgi:hypothetical protein